MAKQSKEYPPDSVVERAIQHCGGTVNELIFRIWSATGTKVSRQNVNKWRNECRFSRNMIAPVHKIAKIPMAELVDAMLNPRDIAAEMKAKGKIVDDVD